MDRRYIDDNHVVARYLADRLTDEEREAFEAYYLEHPEVVQELEAASRFKAGLMSLRDSGELTTLLQPEPRRPVWQYVAAAAAVAAVVVGTLLLVRAPETHPLLAASVDALHQTNGATPVIASAHAILRTRGSSVDAEIPLPPAGKAIELRVLPEFTATRYRVRLFRMSADDSLQSVAEVGGLEPAPDTFVEVFVDGARLRPGQYRLAIVGDPDTDARDKESAFILRMLPPLNDPSAKSR
ncbi:MAG TPA: hypothetical protein VH814_00505 [Steroidobacteraceae bacterium]|jgi:hypothetical protein